MSSLIGMIKIDDSYKDSRLTNQKLKNFTQKNPENQKVKNFIQNEPQIKKVKNFINKRLTSRWKVRCGENNREVSECFRVKSAFWVWLQV